MSENRPLPKTDLRFVVITVGVVNLLYRMKEDRPALYYEMLEEYKKQPDVCLDGGNDKYFFTMDFRGRVKLFVAVNEIGGLTIMLPNEY